MIDPENATNEELSSEEYRLRQEAQKLTYLANLYLHIRIARDARVMLATAEAAKQKALTGTCTCDIEAPPAIGTCPVHQMGGKKGYDKWKEEMAK